MFLSLENIQMIENTQSFSFFSIDKSEHIEYIMEFKCLTSPHSADSPPLPIHVPTPYVLRTIAEWIRWFCSIFGVFRKHSALLQPVW